MSVNAPGVPTDPAGGVSVTVTITVLGWPTTTGVDDTATIVEVLRGFTVCETAEEVMLALKSALPMKEAVIECGLAADDKRDVVNVALPEFSGALPISVVPPSKKLTVPFGTAESPDDVSFTIAVNATAWPRVEPFGNDVLSVVCVVAAFTMSEAVPVLPWKLGSPL